METDRIKDAIGYATQDGEAIRDWVAEQGDHVEGCVVDGSMYSPSWRALAGGAKVWDETTYDDTHAADVQLAYEEELDRITDDLGLYWEEGCLWRAPALETYLLARIETFVAFNTQAAPS